MAELRWTAKDRQGHQVHLEWVDGVLAGDEYLLQRLAWAVEDGELAHPASYWPMPLDLANPRTIDAWLRDHPAYTAVQVDGDWPPVAPDLPPPEPGVAY